MLREEKETIINYNESDEPASVYTFNRALQTRLDQMAAEYPEIVKCTRDYQDGGKEYSIPKKLITVRKPITITEERRSEMAKMALKNLQGGEPQ